MTAAIRLGEYELLCELGSGGMATLYVARQIGAAGVERLVAVKRIHRHVLAVPGIQTMFRDEARLAAAIRHPNVARVLDVVEIDGELLIVLEYLESMSLSALRRAANDAGERLPLPIAVRVLADALAGLHAAHEATDVHGTPLHIVHRDFSPQNVLVASDGTSHLIDFGVAKAASRATQTQSGVLKGKFQYMSPEQARGDELDRRSDVFAAGIVLFEALTGVLPFGPDGSDPSAILLRIMLDPVPAPSTLVDGLPAALDRIVERALERVRDERYPTAASLRDALVEAVEPATDVEVQAVVERWCGNAIAEQRARIQRALIGSSPTLVRAASERPAQTAETVLERAAPRDSAPEQAEAAPPARPSAPATPPRGSLARVAVAAGAATAVLAILAVGLLAGLRWRSDGERAPSRDAAATSVAVVATPADATVVSDAVAALTAPADALPGDASRPKRVERVVVSPPPQPPPQPPPPPRPASVHPDAGVVTPDFTADGALIFHGHEVRSHVRLVRNTTQIPEDTLVKIFADKTRYTLIVYRTGASHLPEDQAPSGTVTGTYHLGHGQFVAYPEVQSTISDSTTSLRASQVLQMFAAQGRDAGPKDASGEIVLSLTFDVVSRNL